MSTAGLVVAILLSQSVPSEPQREGDPARGRDVLLNGGYIRCGVPLSMYREAFGTAPQSWRVPGRRGLNAELPYFMTATRTRSGSTIAAANCLGCHAGWLQGQLVIGLGDASLDQTQRVAPMGHLAQFFTAASDRGDFSRLLRVLDVAEPPTVTDTLGVSSADQLAAVLMAHRDPETLAWSDRALMPVPAEFAPVKVPAWWLMRRKTTMFFTGSGRGDHARLMMSSALLCTDNVKEAEEIDRDFGDVRAYIASLRPPPYPFEIDQALAQKGAPIYRARCEPCHGSANPEGPFPDRIVPASAVGTDALVHEQAQEAAGQRAWFARSFYGKTARLEATAGYVAPPMDGVWARAPYLHNGSVPTLAALLDSSQRPRSWTRSFDSSDYDEVHLGWRFRFAPGPSPRVYDTTRAGYSNAGHTYGDALSAEARGALLEFLKTL